MAVPMINCSNSSDSLISSSVGMSVMIQLNVVGLATQLGGDSVSAYPDCTWPAWGSLISCSRLTSLGLRDSESGVTCSFPGM